MFVNGPKFHMTTFRKFEIGRYVRNWLYTTLYNNMRLSESVLVINQAGFIHSLSLLCAQALGDPMF